MKPEQIAKRDGWVCWLCDSPINPDAPPGSVGAATVDHVVPKSRGGTSAPANLRLAHRRCNGRRGSHLPELIWPKELGLLDAPPLWRSLRHLVPASDRRGAKRRRSARRSTRQSAQPLVIALAPTAESAQAAGEWAAESARRFLGGAWTATAEPTGVSDCHVVRLAVDGPVLDPGNPLT